ncbi:MAG: ABC transporter permease [Candidatus Thiodiazotropha sp. (ex Lucinoma kastoroae)]|nr:ABC transporter permease [Candidatus Thiodiazotropha sp.]MCU7801618.1 ABC transporter permease [Candidatus Thiodiazotropha sp. (ex Lucinoma borealis)]MCU7816430.1 ABC transporter permease [Candidatus Thiodiazotropha sp. (ex Rostrolucina anterorostrata)]MCU7841363.1 ABC transporter permease [Candidatus Thiodiazotropha sp. (ex Troendleina suluensis)]MCU7847462.1 ABC transporter permease [Candidatus Thiodiazotropha sp. (ex Lucinoma kastoroae)]MCU7885470.1 ABC transporter permease [Candidatus T
MGTLSDTTLAALNLLLSGNAELWEIIAISFRVSGVAILIASPPALLVAFLLTYKRFPGRRLLISINSTFLSIPAVVIGLTFFILLSRQGPLGEWRLLFTQTAMVLGQIALAFPILVAMGHSALQAADRRAWETARTLGANLMRAVFTIMREARFGLMAAFLAAFGRIIAEVGASMMLGGNILHYTRNIPTAIALESSKGEFAQGIALGLVLLTLAFTLNALLQHIQGKGQPVS